MGSRRWAVLRDPLENEGTAEARPATEAGAGPDQRLKFLLWFVVGAGCATFLSAFVQHPDLFSHVPATWKRRFSNRWSIAVAGNACEASISQRRITSIGSCGRYGPI